MKSSLLFSTCFFKFDGLALQHLNADMSLQGCLSHCACDKPPATVNLLEFISSLAKFPSSPVCAESWRTHGQLTRSPPCTGNPEPQVTTKRVGVYSIEGKKLHCTQMLCKFWVSSVAVLKRPDCDQEVRREYGDFSLGSPEGAPCAEFQKAEYH